MSRCSSESLRVQSERQRSDTGVCGLNPSISSRTSSSVKPALRAQRMTARRFTADSLYCLRLPTRVVAGSSPIRS